MLISDNFLSFTFVVCVKQKLQKTNAILSHVLVFMFLKMNSFDYFEVHHLSGGQSYHAMIKNVGAIKLKFSRV